MPCPKWLNSTYLYPAWKPRAPSNWYHRYKGLWKSWKENILNWRKPLFNLKSCYSFIGRSFKLKLLLQLLEQSFLTVCFAFCNCTISTLGPTLSQSCIYILLQLQFNKTFFNSLYVPNVNFHVKDKGVDYWTYLRGVFRILILWVLSVNNI